MRISDWSSDVCSSDLHGQDFPSGRQPDSAAATLAKHHLGVRYRRLAESIGFQERPMNAVDLTVRPAGHSSQQGGEDQARWAMLRPGEIAQRRRQRANDAAPSQVPLRYRVRYRDSPAPTVADIGDRKSAK